MWAMSPMERRFKVVKSQSRLEIVQGDTAGIWKLGHVISAPGVKPKVYADLSNPDYSCSIKALRDEDGSVAVAERAVTQRTPDNFHFLCALLPAETALAGCAPGDITVGLQLSNPALIPPLRRELHRGVRIHANINANT